MNNDMPQPLERELKAFHTTHKIYFACAPKSLKKNDLRYSSAWKEDLLIFIFYFFPVTVSLVIHI